MRIYNEYKDSGIEWLGQIPEHWSVKKLKHATKVNPSKSEVNHVKKLDVTFLPMENLSVNGILDLSAIKDISEVYSGFTYFIDNDVVIAKITPCFENGKSALVHSLKNGIGFGTTELHVLRPQSNIAYQKFIYYQITLEKFIQYGQLHMNGVAGQQRVPSDFISDWIIPIPTLKEQQQIADYLDQQTAKIDELVQKQNKLIELLQEKKKSLINHVVTKGLNPDVQMKDGGIEWLGQIPTHWEVKRLKYYIAGEQNGIWGDEAKGDKNDIICLRVADFDREHLITQISDNLTVRNIEVDKVKNRILKYDDLLIEKSGGGENQLVGFVTRYISELPVVCSNFVAKLSLANDVDAKYTTYLFSSFYNSKINYKSIKQTSGIQNIDTEQYFNEVAPHPPLPEQQQIADYLDQQTSKIDNLISKAKSMVDLLKEHKQSLINNVVTGKIKVTNEEAQ